MVFAFWLFFVGNLQFRQNAVKVIKEFLQCLLIGKQLARPGIANRIEQQSNKRGIRIIARFQAPTPHRPDTIQRQSCQLTAVNCAFAFVNEAVTVDDEPDVLYRSQVPNWSETKNRRRRKSRSVVDFGTGVKKGILSSTKNDGKNQRRRNKRSLSVEGEYKSEGQTEMEASFPSDTRSEGPRSAVQELQQFSIPTPLIFYSDLKTQMWITR